MFLIRNRNNHKYNKNFKNYKRFDLKIILKMNYRKFCQNLKIILFFVSNDFLNQKWNNYIFYLLSKPYLTKNSFYLSKI